MTQEPVQEDDSLIRPSSLVGLCVPYIVARSLRLARTLLFSGRSTAPSARLQKLCLLTVRMPSKRRACAACAAMCRLKGQESWALTLLLSLIHRSAWKVNSANLAITEF